MPIEKTPGAVRATVQAWDLPTRLVHWSLVILIFCAWLSRELAGPIGDDTLRWHRWNGYAILVLLVFRLLWGFVGSSTSRFAAFIRWPWRVVGYIRDLLTRKDRRYLGHNPLGAWMIIGLLLSVAAQAVFGMYMMDDNGILVGPLKRTISDELATTLGQWHIRWFNVILALIAIHIVANLSYALIKREPLIRAMVTGKKPVEPYQDQSEAVIVKHLNLRALVCLIVAAGIVYGGVIGLGGRF